MSSLSESCVALNSIEAAMASEAIPGSSNEEAGKSEGGCPLCSLAAKREFVAVEIFPGASMSIVREDPTSAVVRFKAGSVEPAHHHTFGHDIIVTSGRKRVWNVSKGEVYDLGAGDFMYTPAGDVHRVQYLTDTEFFIKWDGRWDIFLDEDLPAAAAAIQSAQPENH